MKQFQIATTTITKKGIKTSINQYDTYIDAYTDLENQINTFQKATKGSIKVNNLNKNDMLSECNVYIKKSRKQTFVGSIKLIDIRCKPENITYVDMEVGYNEYVKHEIKNHIEQMCHKRGIKLFKNGLNFVSSNIEYDLKNNKILEEVHKNLAEQYFQQDLQKLKNQI